MQIRRAFTLVELLVVIAILAVLMGLLFPVLGRARKSAQAVVCQGRLRQWGQIFSMYVQEHDGVFQARRQFNPLLSYGGEGRLQMHPELLLCPSATRPAPGTADYEGGTFSAYRYSVNSLQIRYGSYGISVSIASQDHPCFWGTCDVKGTSNIPLVFDSTSDSAGTWNRSLEDPPEQEGRGEFPVSHVCINRHHEGINMLFMDWSVRKVGLKELWTLRWNRVSNTANKWTKAGGVRPGDWPEWMRQFKDY
jgi:prepilin-type N-terminal cleavage/methylation domain-containing protein